FAWPVAIVLAVHAATRRAGWRFAAAALAPPLATGLPVVLADPGAAMENVVAYPSGRGVVASPAASPLPGRLIATALPAGRTVALVLLLLAALAPAACLV